MLYTLRGLVLDMGHAECSEASCASIGKDPARSRALRAAVAARMVTWPTCTYAEYKKEKLMRLILIRHGESLHSQRRMIAGVASCPGLTARGFEQSRILARRLEETGELRDATQLLSSPVLRARQTAEILAPCLPQCRLSEDIRLSELLPGDADGLLWQEYVSRYEAFDLVTEPDRPFAPGGESWQDFGTRVHAMLNEMIGVYAQQTVVGITHAGFIVMAMLELFSIPRPGTGTRIDPSFTSLTEWQYSNAEWQLLRFNDIAHLQEHSGSL